MGKQHKTEEQLKADIFSIYSRYFDEGSSDRRQVHFMQICEAVISWCTDYLNIKAKEMGIEIYNAIQRLVKDNNARVPKDEDGFFKYLRKVLSTAQKEYYRDIRSKETDNIKISRETLKKLKMVEEMITAQEIQTGRKITENERRQYISRWFSTVEYTRLINLINASTLDINPNASTSTDPQDELLAKLYMQNLKGALELVLQRTQDRSRECNRSLFTAYCINKYKDFEVLVPLLDSKILEDHQKSGEKPPQYEIYLKYHPDAKKKSAEAIAAKITKDFLKKLEEALQEKNQ